MQRKLQEIVAIIWILLSFEKFKSTQLPSEEDFYNDLGECHIDEKWYENTNIVRNLINIKNMGEWHDLYAMIHTLLCET